MDGDTALNTDLYFFILFAATIIVVIVMLNLLIAIISDSFEKVMAIERQAEVFEKLQLIISSRGQLGKKLFSIKEKWERVYLCLLKKENNTEDDNIEERIRWKIDALLQRTSSIEENIAAKSKTESALVDLITKFEGKIVKTEETLVNISKSISNIENTLQKIEISDPKEKIS